MGEDKDSAHTVLFFPPAKPQEQVTDAFGEIQMILGAKDCQKVDTLCRGLNCV